MRQDQTEKTGDETGSDRKEGSWDMRQDQIGKKGDETGSDRKEGSWDMRQDQIGKTVDETGSDRKEGSWDMRLLGQWPNCCSGGPDWSVTSLCWVLHGSLKCYITLQSVTWFTEVLQDSSEVGRDFTEVWHYWSVAGLQWSGTWHHWSVITLLKWCRTPVVLCATLHWNVGEAFPINASGVSQNSTEPVILAKGLCYRIGHHVSCGFWIWHWIIIITPTSHHPLLNAVDLCWCHHQLCFDWLLISLIYMVRSFLLIQVYSVSSFLLISVDSVIHIV